MTEKERKMLQEHIDMIIENFIDEEFLAEKSKKDNKPRHSTKWEKKAGRQDKRKPKTKSKKDKSSDEKDKNEKNTKIAGRRARVIQWLKDPSVNCAEIMRKLWRPSKKKEDAARSFFYKCRDGALNDSGVAYSFSNSDINRLYAIKNNLM